MEKKYQVFVSSTYLDLLEERQEVMYGLLELNCIPAGMELFPAANEDQWSLIKRVIDECDYYLVIIAGRYGSIGREGKSYTQMEYEYAVLQRKPVIAFLHRDPSSLPDTKREKTKEGQKRLEEFRELAQKRTCRFWTSSSKLKADAITSLISLIKNNSAPGWVRGDLSGVVYDELAELERLLKKQKIYGRTSLLRIVESIVNKYGEDVWKSWSSEVFMDKVNEIYEYDPTNLTYWWLLVYGVFRFKNISRWYDDVYGRYWEKSVKYSEYTERGKKFLQKLQELSIKA